MPNTFPVTVDNLNVGKINPQTSLDFAAIFTDSNSIIFKDFIALCLKKNQEELDLEEFFIQRGIENIRLTERERAHLLNAMRDADLKAREKFLESFIEKKLPAATTDSAVLAAMREQISQLCDELTDIVTQQAQLIQQQVTATVTWQTMQQTAATQAVIRLAQAQQNGLVLPVTNTQPLVQMAANGQPVVGANGQPVLTPRGQAIANAMMATPPAVLARVNPALNNFVLPSEVGPNTEIEKRAECIVDGQSVHCELKSLAALGADKVEEDGSYEPLAGASLLNLIKAAKQFALLAKKDSIAKGLMVEMIANEFKRTADIRDLAAKFVQKETEVRAKVEQAVKNLTPEQRQEVMAMVRKS